MPPVARNTNSRINPKSQYEPLIIRQQILKPRCRQGCSENSMPIAKLLDGCTTDPEPDMERRRAPCRDMRSKCRCSYVLQFTFRRAVSCVLHRPPSQVIHCIVLFFQSFAKNKFCSVSEKQRFKSVSHPVTGHNTNPRGGKQKSFFDPSEEGYRRTGHWRAKGGAGPPTLPDTVWG